MSESRTSRPNLFPKWTNLLPTIAAGAALGGAGWVVVVSGYGFHASTLAVGYAPKQPVEYSHAVHVGQLGMDCRYCHNTVEDTAQAALPPSKTCWNCHGKTVDAKGAESGPGIQWKGEKLRPLKALHTAGEPVPWVKVHDLADYAYFDHSVHVNSGVGCVECHGRVDKMEVVSQHKDLSMAWCIECHRAPQGAIRPQQRVFELDWDPTTATTDEKKEIERLQSHLKSPRKLTDCSTCHR